MRRFDPHFPSLPLGPFGRLVARKPMLAGATGTAISACVLIFTFIVLAMGRQQELDRAKANSLNVAITLSHEIARNVELYDLSLQAVAEGAADSRVQALPKDLRHKVLFDRSTAARYVSGVYVVDRAGNITDGRDVGAVHANVADRDYFTAQMARAQAGLFISRPYRSRARDGAWSIALSRRITLSDGSFGGIASLAVNTDYFYAMTQALIVGPNGASFILQKDGTIVARNPILKAGEPNSVAHSPTFGRMLANEQGFYIARSAVDGLMRLYSFAHVPGTNLIAVVAPSYDDVLRDWRHRSHVIGALAVLLSAAFAYVVWALAFGLRYRISLQAHVTHIAHTDALTQLLNRGALEEGLERAWNDCGALGVPMSMLFVDADRFKAYNDNFGHAAGDAALRMIADCLSRQTRAGVDIVARYGGEEFVIVLPGAGLSDAVRVGESIRECVETTSRAGERSGVHPLTISVGCSTIMPSSCVTTATGLLAADRAVYVAKQRGRNQVSVATAAMYQSTPGSSSETK
ncbi:sensor domain-containing diguanylate cyclase [Caballeronia sp. LZ025]|uniref:GGDEF domain-containing protein n=1 Tax=Caballeronia TaxID=1827195 RepID=UPI001FD16D10|nr:MULTISPECIES: sensor domain-containing diguanylate cyclase [Caballeronia]MDR5736276.1 sensor domain-containing diguanylate cyclase [Caballeronia sp. LZ025]